MATIQSGNSPLWVQKRVLAFLNAAQTAADIVAGIPDAPNNGPGYGIGETVAQRILDKRNSLPVRRFRTVEQLSDIDGLGLDKWEDMLHAAMSHSAENFRKRLFADKVLQSNWEVEHYTQQFSDLNLFRQLVNNVESLRHYVAGQVGPLVYKSQGNQTLGRLAEQSIRQTWVEGFTDAHMGSHAWALWFYRFDADNWFSFGEIQTAIETYLGSFSSVSEEIGLYLFKGFDNRGTLVRGISVSDLPVTVSYAEQSISIWSVALFD